MSVCCLSCPVYGIFVIAACRLQQLFSFIIMFSRFIHSAVGIKRHSSL